MSQPRRRVKTRLVQQMKKRRRTNIWVWNSIHHRWYKLTAIDAEDGLSGVDIEFSIEGDPDATGDDEEDGEQTETEGAPRREQATNRRESSHMYCLTSTNISQLPSLKSIKFWAHTAPSDGC
jgi:hypothetical protein